MRKTDMSKEKIMDELQRVNGVKKVTGQYKVFDFFHAFPYNSFVYNFFMFAKLERGD